MAIELITGRAGTPHVDSADVGAFNAAMFGGGIYTVSGCAATLADANHVQVSAGELMCEGRHIRITGSGETLTIDNGLSGYRRIDIIAMRYTRNSSDIEECSLVVVKGAQSTSTPQDPAMPATGKLLDGASNVYWPLYRITIDGLTPQAPEKMAEDAPVITNEGGNVLERLGAADHVIANGKSGYWTWRKYESGIAECWYSQDYQTNINNQGEGAYFSAADGMYLPFSMTESSVNLTCTSHGHIVDVVYSMLDSRTEGKYITYYLKCGIALSPVYVGINAYVIGRWK